MKKQIILFIATILWSASFNMTVKGDPLTSTYRCLGINNKNFIQKLDSIISGTQFTPETPIFEFVLMGIYGKYEDYPPNLLSIRKYLEVMIVDSIPKHPDYNNYSILKTVNTQQTNEFYIYILAQEIPSVDMYHPYYLFYNKHHYFFNTIIRPDFYRSKRTKAFKPKSIWHLPPWPTWIIKYSNGNMQLIDFYINNDTE